MGVWLERSDEDTWTGIGEGRVSKDAYEFIGVRLRTLDNHQSEYIRLKK